MTALRVLCDLRQRFEQARDQGARPTCLAFAASDAHAAARGAPFMPLSAEWAYYHAVRRDGGTPDSGATLPGMLDAVRVDGQPVEAAWPYANGPGPDPATWAPPGGVCELFKRNSRQVGGATLGSITAVLDGGSPALVVMTISDAFYLPGKGGIVSAAEPVDSARVHAVVVVGHGVLGDGNAAVLVRNSWGPEWGEGGCAWLTESYLAPRLRRFAIMTEEV